MLRFISHNYTSNTPEAFRLDAVTHTSPRTDEFSSNVQRISGSMDARNERGADRDVSKYVDGAPQFMTQQTRSAGVEFAAPQQSRHMRQKGVE